MCACSTGIMPYGSVQAHDTNTLCSDCMELNTLATMRYNNASIDESIMDQLIKRPKCYH